jgi:hypothetical protein
MPRQMIRPILMAALGCAVLGLAACDDASWVGQAIKGGQGSGAPSGKPGGPSSAGGAAPCATGGTGGTGGQPAPTCVTKSSQGDSSSCKPAATWKQYASDDCAATGATLTGYSPDEACGDGNSRSVKYTCCLSEAAPPPPPPTCVTKSQGSPSSCKGAPTWKQYATDNCAATGASLTDISPYEDCGDGGTRYVKYTCCSLTSPPPPPPPTCVTKSSQGGSSSCMPAATWKQYASDDCAATGATLTGYSPDEACGDGNSRSVKYTCCSSEAAPPVSPAAK